MRIQRSRKDTPTLNTTATADISFILLIFFLVATSFNAYKGLEKNVTPDNEEQTDKTQMKQRNVLQLQLHADNTITHNETIIQEPLLYDIIVRFIENAANLPTLPEHSTQYIAGIGKCTSTFEHQIILTTDRNASYDTYYFIQNTIHKAYNALRDKTASTHFGKQYDALTPVQQQAVRKIYPLHLIEETTEAMPQQIVN